MTTQFSTVYVLKRTDQGGGYVAPEGSLKAYTNKPGKARRFASFEEANRNRCCENEIAITLAQALGL